MAHVKKNSLRERERERKKKLESDRWRKITKSKKRRETKTEKSMLEQLLIRSKVDKESVYSQYL